MKSSYISQRVCLLNQSKKLYFLFLLCALVLPMALILTGCDPVPGKNLTAAQKAEDMQWLFSRFEEYYAPREYKEQRYKFDYEKLKAEYLQEAINTKSNDEFYSVMQKFVAEFHDAHTSLTFTPSPLPGRAQIAFLGITGKRLGDNFLVTEILPIIKPQDMPIKVGDRITHINGKPIIKYIDKELAPYRNYGNPESNHTLLMGPLFTRISLQFPIPKDPTIELTVVSDISGPSAPSSRNIALPWIVKDLRDFKIEQSWAKAKLSKSSRQSALWVPLENEATGQAIEIALVDQNGDAITFEDFESLKQGEKGILENYKFISIQGWTANKEAVRKKKNQSPFEKLKTKSWVADNALPIVSAQIFPAYVTSVDVKDPKTGKPTGAKKLVGTIRIDSFSYPDSSVEDLKNTLDRFQALGVRDVVVDTLDNPGGSLTLVMKVAQAFSNKKLTMPQQKFGLNAWWLDMIQTSAIESTGAKQELFKRLYTELKAEADTGARLSKSYNMEAIIPYQIEPNYRLKENFNLSVLVSELNASCGDIFPLIMQQNKVATIVGTKTMGAGGNVVNFMQAPNSKADLRQTLSLVVKKNGKYLENNGVVPDIEVNPHKKLATLLAYKDASSVSLKYAIDLHSYNFGEPVVMGYAEKTGKIQVKSVKHSQCQSAMENI